MKLTIFIFLARFWLTLLVSVGVTLGAASADIHPPDADETACEATQIIHHVDADFIEMTDHLRGSNDDDDHERDHDHHVHNCGSCHVHILGWDISNLYVSHALKEKFSLLISAEAPRGPPIGLYRPPIA